MKKVLIALSLLLVVACGNNVEGNQNMDNVAVEQEVEATTTEGITTEENTVADDIVTEDVAVEEVVSEDK